MSIADEIHKSKLKDINNYNKQHGVVLSLELIDFKKYPINYDKDSYQNSYSYKLKNLTTQTEEYLVEVVEKNTYFFKQLKASYKVGDTINYYKNQTETITKQSYDFSVNYKDRRPVDWFAITLLILSSLGIFILVKPIFKSIDK